MIGDISLIDVRMVFDILIALVPQAWMACPP